MAIVAVISHLAAAGAAWPAAESVSAAPAPAEQAKAKAPTNDDCLGCHGDPSATRANGTSIAVSPAVFAASIHGQAGQSCVDCHTDLATTAEFPHAEKLAPVNCATCHDEAAQKYATSVHAEARRASPGSPAATCKDCHGTHNIRPASDPDSSINHLNLPATCGRCHGNPEIIKRAKIAVGNVYRQFQDSIHGQALAKSGLVVAPNCSDCHGFHDIQRRSNPQSHVYRTNVPDTCGKCHNGIERQYLEGIHGQQLKDGNPLAPECANCHTAHSIQRVEAESWRLQVIRECGTCHAESIKTYRDTFHGQVTRLGFVRVAACADCHSAHNIFPPSDPRSSVSPARLVTTCRKCHPGANARFVKYDPHADRQDRQRNPMLFYAGRFMTSLLVGVFAFFGIHTTLWFSRSVRARHQQERAAAPRGPANDRQPPASAGEGQGGRAGDEQDG